MEQNRRFFLRQIGIVSAGTMMRQNLFANTIAQPVNLFIDESGIGRDISIIGVLKSENIEKNEKKIKLLREKNHYKRTLRYRSTDKYKLQFSKDLIDYFFEDPLLSFYARFISTDVVSKNDKKVDETIIYKLNLKEVIMSASKNTITPFLIGAKRNNYSYLDETEMNGYLKKNLSSGSEVKFEAERYHVSQLSDLFTGSVYADTRPIYCDIKLELLEHLKQKLKVKKISEMYNKRGEQKFVITAPQKA